MFGFGPRLCFIVIILLMIPVTLQAQYMSDGSFAAFPAVAEFPQTQYSPVAAIDYPGFYARFGIKKFINSFASYQFNDPDSGTDPLSRLEFPFDNWFAGVEFSKVYGNLSFSCSFWNRVNKNLQLKLQDSDWEGATTGYPLNQKTTFSESQNRMEEGYFADVNADWLIFSRNGISLRPLAGFMWQSLRFIGGDGWQYSLPGVGPPAEPLEGDTFDVRFNFRNFYVGAKSYLNYAGIGVTLQGDYGWVYADDSDRHLLRGTRQTTDTCYGNGWHLAATADVFTGQRMNCRLEFDFRRMSASKGLHKMWDDPDVYEQWNGAKIWSEQKSVTAFAELKF